MYIYTYIYIFIHTYIYIYICIHVFMYSRIGLLELVSSSMKDIALLRVEILFRVVGKESRQRNEESRIKGND